MTKTYKINGKEIPQAGIWEDGKGNFRGMATEDVVNQLIEALADREGYCGWCDMGVTKSGHLKECPDYKPKQEEWKGCGICNCKYPQFCEGCYKADYKCRVCDNEPKQPTSLKEEIIETIWMAHGQSAVVPNTADKILSLIQSHLVKEIENLTQETVLDDLKREFPVLYKQDIIKIINNITK